MLGQFFILSPRGDTLVYRDCILPPLRHSLSQSNVRAEYVVVV